MRIRNVHPITAIMICLICRFCHNCQPQSKKKAIANTKRTSAPLINSKNVGIIVFINSIVGAFLVYNPDFIAPAKRYIPDSIKTKIEMIK